jgi:RsiW-degrading membrane proteinase PrsW (M82 family)
MERPMIAQSPAAAVKTMKIIHGGLLAGQVLFAGVAYSTGVKAVYFNARDTKDVFFFVATVLAFGGIVAGFFLFKQLIGQLIEKTDLRSKLAGYQGAFITRSALLEGPSLFSIVAFMQSGNLFYLVISGFLMLILLRCRPTANRIAEDLDLGYDDKAELGADL